MPPLLRSLTTFSAFTLVSRLFGFARDLVLARVFGADAATDAFFVAFKIPNFLRRLFAEGAFAAAFVPVLSEYRDRRPREELKAFIDDIAGTLGGVLTLVTLLGILGAGGLVLVFAPGFAREPDKYALATDMLRLTFPYLFFISLTAFAGSILNTYRQFAVPAFTPVLLNLSLIGCALWLAPWMEQPVMALAWGVLIAGLLQFALQLPFLARLNLLPRPRLRRDPGVKRVLWLMVPALFGVSVTQLSLLLDTLLASFLPTGSISWLYYSDRLMEFPLGILGVGLGTVILPSLSKQHVRTSPEAFQQTLDWALRWVLLLGLPAALGLLVLAQPLMATLFLSERFLAEDVRMAGASLMAYSLGLLAFMAIKVLAPGFYARQDTKTPVRIAVVAMLANMVLNLLLAFALGLGHVGLALATSLAALLNAGLLLRELLRQGVYRFTRPWFGLLARVTLACLGMVLVLWWGGIEPDAWLADPTLTRVGRLAALILAGLTTYGLLLALLGIRSRDFRA